LAPSPAFKVVERVAKVAIWLSVLLSHRAIAVMLPELAGLVKTSDAAFQAVTPTGVDVAVTDRSPVLLPGSK
jgi:hypothetical protein